MSKQEDAWQQFADAVGGQMEYEENGWWIFKEREYRVTAPIGRWSLTLDTFTEMTSAVIAAGYASMRYVRMTVPYDGLPSPRFKIERAGFFGRLGRRAGTQKIETGDAEFDKYFTLWGGDAQQVRHLFASASLREAVREALPIDAFEGRDNQLYVQSVGTMRNAQRLIDLYKLFKVTLNRLEETDPASDPSGPPEDSSLPLP